MPSEQRSPRGHVRSSRGHVRVERGRDWLSWVIGAGTLVLLIITVGVLANRFVLPLFEDDSPTTENSTWLEFEWTRLPVNQSAIEQLAERLRSSQITRIYLEANAWRGDGTLVEGDYAADFVAALKVTYPDISVLLWLRMSGEEIAQTERHAAVIDLARKAVDDWKFDGVQLNGRAVYKGSESYIQLLRDLREAVGAGAVLSVTVPPDRIPTDPDVPVGSTLDADLTWDVDYKQRVGLLGIDEMMIMAYASGLQDSEQYKVWVGYQIVSYVDALSELERWPVFSVALPTYDAGPEYDPAVESIAAATAGVELGMSRLGEQRDAVRGVGLYEYKTTDSLEWALYRDEWLGAESD